MALWILSAFALFGGVAQAARSFRLSIRRLSVEGELRIVREVRRALQELRDLLEAGLLPPPEAWARIANLPAPWGEAAHRNLQELRQRGCAVLPTLKRLVRLSRQQEDALLESRSRGSQALAQAWTCFSLVPIFGGLLAWLLPGVGDSPMAWATACVIAGCAGLGAALWLMEIGDSARWGMLPRDQREWMLLAPFTLEGLLARVRAGVPADVAWTDALQSLESQAPALARAWPASIWAASEPDAGPLDQALAAELEPDLELAHASAGESSAVASLATVRFRASRLWRAFCARHHGRLRARESKSLAPKGSGLPALLRGVGEDIRQAIQVSLLEGRPCAERIESALEGLATEIRAGVERSLTLMPSRTLMPLFTLIAPAILGLLFFGIYLSWTQLLGEVL